MSKFESTEKLKRIKRHPVQTAVVYIRVSSQEQIDNFSIPTQIKLCREFLKEEKIKEVGIFIEEGESAKTSQRTQLQNLLYFIASNKGRVDNVLVYKLDRWSRSQSDFFALKSILLKSHTNLLSVTEKVDDTPTGKFLEGIFSGLAQLDNELKGQRVKACLTTKALDGWYPTTAPYGYLNDPKTKTLVRDDRYFKQLKIVMHKFCTGESTTDLAKHLNDQGLRTRGSKLYPPRKFKTKDVWKILSKSMFYAGYFDWKEHKDIKGKHESIITWNEHLIIQGKLFNKNIVKTTDKEGNDVFFLNFTVKKEQGFLICDGCGDRMRSCFSKGKLGKKYPYYYCKNSHCTSKKKSISKVDLENLIAQEVSKLTTTPKFAKIFKKEVREVWEREAEILKKTHDSAKHKGEMLKFDKKQTIAMRRRKELSIEEYEDEMNRIRAELVVADLEAEESKIDFSHLRVLLDQSELFLTKIEPLYRGFGITHKQRFLALVFPEGVRFMDGKCRTPEKGYIFNRIEEIEEGKKADFSMVTLKGDFMNQVIDELRRLLCTNSLHFC